MKLGRRVIPLFLIVQGCLAWAPTAEELIEAGHWKRARALVERRLREAPDDANAVFLWSQILNAFGDRVSPPSLAERAIRLDGTVARYHRQLAEAYGVMALKANLLHQLLLARKFRKEIDTALKLDPRDVQAQRDLLEFFLLAPGIAGGDPKRAEVAARQIATIDAPDGFLAWARIAEFRKDRAQTERMLRQAAEARPPSYKARVALARFYLDGGRDEAAAEAQARSALGLDGGRTAAYCILAAVYAGQARWGALETTLSAAVSAVSDDAAPFYCAAQRLLADHREPGRAEGYLRLYLAQEPEGDEPTASQAHWQLGLALHAQAQRAAAIREWKAAVRLDAESPAGRELKGN
jgi:tetratricopeptide (TPR) repeat protein